MFDYNSNSNVVGVEIPNQIAAGDIQGSPVSHIESAIREGLGLRKGEDIEDFVGTVVTGAKKEATSILTEIALQGSNYTLDEYQNARDEKDWDTVNEIEDTFRFNIIVDIAPINWQADQLRKSDQEFANDGELFDAAYREAIKMRNRNLYDPDRESQRLGDLEIDKVIVISDGRTSSRSLVDDVMFNGTDVAAVAFNDLVEDEPSRSRSGAVAPADD